jgi:hypothetical protein
MPEEISQAAQTGAVQPAGAQVPEPTTAQVSTQTEPRTEEKPLTIDEMRRIAVEEATRIAQSQVAKGENRIEKRIQEQVAALKLNAGVLGLSEEQVTQAKQKIVTEAYTAEPPQAGAPTSDPNAAPDVERAIQFMNAEIGNVFAEVGTSVTSADPEFKELQGTIDRAWNDPKGLTKILLAASKAASAKAGRIASQQENAQARVVSGGGESTTGGVSSSASGRDLLSDAYSKK